MGEKAVYTVLRFLYGESCSYTGCTAPAYWAPQNTAYTNLFSNYACLCEKHHKENAEYWTERWNDYYSGLI